MQPDLFDAGAALPPGLAYHAEFLSPAGEAALLCEIQRLAFRQARFQQYTARRRVVRFGVADEESDFPPIEFPPFLHALREAVAKLTGIPAARFEHGLVTEYSPGTPIGWHRDAPHHEMVAGFSLANECRMRFRPMHSTGPAIALSLQPRSLYLMSDEVRWHWQHSIPPVKALRYSVTLRTQRTSPR